MRPTTTLPESNLGTSAAASPPADHVLRRTYWRSFLTFLMAGR